MFYYNLLCIYINFSYSIRLLKDRTYPSHLFYVRFLKLLMLYLFNEEKYVEKGI